MNAPRALPARVTLPAAPLIGAAHLRIALGGVSRAVLSLWRAERGFPAGHREGREVLTLTEAVADWCRANGTEVRR